MSVGYIKLHRSLLSWQHWDDHNTTRLLVYFLVSVNYESKKWKGIEILPGSMVASYDRISLSTGLSIQQIRRSIKVLVNDNQITQETTNRFQLITLVKWVELQLEDKINNRQTTGKQQANNRQTTTTKEVKKERSKEVINILPDINSRKQVFYNSLIPFIETFSKEMIRDFYEYWIEHGDRDKKMRFEKEKTFGLSRRLSTWNRNIKKFNTNGTGKQPINNRETLSDRMGAVKQRATERRNQQGSSEGTNIEPFSDFQHVD